MTREAKRRQYGTGSVHPAHAKDCPHHDRKDVSKCSAARSQGGWGCRMRATIEFGYTKAGGRHRPTVTGKTEAEVRRKLKELQREVARGREASTRTTVKAWSETWLADRAHRDRPKTHTTDQGAMRWIVEAIGKKRLTDLTPADVRAVDDAVRAAGLSTSTALRYRGTLRRMLKAADAEGHAIPPRVLTVRPPAAAVNDRQAIPTPDVLRLLAAAGELPWGSRWVAAFLLGLRQGEALGLTWPEVGADTLTVSWQLQRPNYRDKKDRSKGFLLPDGFECRQLVGAAHLTRPKSRAGWRVLPLLPVLADALEAWRLVAPPSPYDLVWPAIDGSPKVANDDREEWHRLQDAAKVRHPSGRHYHVHEARHSTAMLLRELRVPESIIVQIMGHSTVASTNAYLHRDIELAREQLGPLAQLLKLG